MGSAPRDGADFLAVDKGGEMMVVNWPAGYALGRWSFMRGRWGGSSVAFLPRLWKGLPTKPTLIKGKVDGCKKSAKNKDGRLSGEIQSGAVAG